MKRRLGSMVSAGFIMCLAFAGLLEGAMAEKCRMQACDRSKFDSAVQDYCILAFSQSMANTNYEFTCPWPGTKRHYVELMQCLQSVGSSTCCTHTSYTQRLLMNIHEQYFNLCSFKNDPPVPILLLLVVPCTLVPLLVPLLFQHFKLYKAKPLCSD